MIPQYRIITCHTRAIQILDHNITAFFFLYLQGDLALVDFPHPREHCVSFAFGSQLHCKMCFCIVCDLPAVGV